MVLPVALTLEGEGTASATSSETLSLLDAIQVVGVVDEDFRLF